ncbi:MAG: DNA-binding domain-containing protein, partial [Undibacterium sp.]|nr:DNA-binding domain-containing protein [Undibacterium sp.]
MTLALLQQRFAASLLDVTASHADLCSTPEGLVSDRLAFYRGNMMAHGRNTLSNVYPVLKKLVGEDFFESMSTAYVKQFPSQSGDLNEFGEYLAHYIESSNMAPEYPYFADVARLEWQVHRAYYAQDAACLGLSEFLGEVGEHAAQASLVLHPAVGLYQASYDSVAIFLALQDDEVKELRSSWDQVSYAVVTRPKWKVEILSLSASSLCALQTLQQGHSLEY